MSSRGAEQSQPTIRKRQTRVGGIHSLGRIAMTPDDLRHKLIADLFECPVWERGTDRIVTPGWQHLSVEARDLIADALQKWRP